jgi:glycosyltransferase involved in cell wall biosynthesis
MTTSLNSSQQPMVSVVIPVRNEADFIEKTIKSFLYNDYPSNRIEILVVDGMSDDGTREIVQTLASTDVRVRLLDNPRKITPVAMNIGIMNAKGDIIVIMGGHATVATDFVSQSVRILHEHPEICCAGGVMETVGTNYISRVIAAAMSSPFGVGGGNFRVRKSEGYVNTVPFGAHHRWIFEKIGMFDEELVRNQDDEFIHRMIEAGEKQYLTPTIKSTYYCRSSLRKLFRQYFQYGFWRIRTIQKRGRPATFRQIIPMLFVSGLGLLAVGALLWQPLILFFIALCIAYGSFLFVGAATTYRNSNFTIALLVPIAFVLMHFGYGFGSLYGMWSWIILQGKFVSAGEAHKMSR